MVFCKYVEKYEISKKKFLLHTIFKYIFLKFQQKLIKKSRIRETKHLSTEADSSTDNKKSS